MIKKLFHRYFELVFWTAALIALALSDPTKEAHFNLCPLRLLGFTWCPGCGLGHAVSYLFRGDIVSSFHAHWLGIPTVMILLNRIYVLGRQRIYPATFHRRYTPAHRPD